MRWSPRDGATLARMNGLSDPTLGVLVDAGTQLAKSQLRTALMHADLYKYGSQEENKDEIIRSRLLGARDAAGEGDTGAHRGLLAFAADLVQRTVKNPEHPPSWFGDLRDALLADGYELTFEGTPPFALPSGRPVFGIDSDIRYKIFPTDAAPVPLGETISALETELAARGYTIALNHYRQAVDGLTNHKFESANSDLRAALEDLVTCLAEDHAGYQRRPRAGQGGPAVDCLITSGQLPERDGGTLLRGLWQLTHTNGSHPGQSNADEARFRMQVITATARFLLRHFPDVT